MESIKVIYITIILTLTIAGLASCENSEQLVDILFQLPRDGYANLLQNIPQVEEPYEPKGRTSFIEFLNTTVYDTHIDEDSSGPLRILIAVHDRNGPNDHIRQIADKIAEGKSTSGQFRVLVPDFFRGSGETSWETGTNADVRNIINYYQQDDGSSVTTSFGIFGFCWGGRISVKAGQELSAIKGVGLIHPTNVLTEDAYSLQSAALLLPTLTDPDMDPFEEILLNQAGIDSVFHRRFTDMAHGFAGAGGNWSVPLVNQRVDQVISYSIDFFNKHL